MGWILGLGNGVVFRTGGGSSYWISRTPTLLTLSNVGYPEGIKLDWINAGVADYDGTSIERSADGITYAEIDTVAAGVVTYTDSTAVFQTEYYYRVRAYKGTNYSPYSNIESLEVTSDRFIITVDTTKAGSANDTFVLPTTGAGYDAWVDWGDGGAEQNITGTPGNVTHVYAASGTYQIRIRGTFPRIYFNNVGDKEKLLYIDNWGSIDWSSFEKAFKGCSIMQGRYKDTPYYSGAASFNEAFNKCLAFNYTVANFINDKVVTINYMFSSVTNFNQPLTGWDTQNISTARDAFRSAPAFKQSLAGFNIKRIRNFTNLCTTTNINDAGTTNYDATLISFAAQAVLYSKRALTTSFGTSQYGEGLVDNGTTDGVAANKLIQSGQNFLTTVTVGDVVYNTTDGTYAFVTAIDSDTQLSISVDIMASGEVYRIQHSDAAKARAQLVIPVLDGGQGWTITDGGYA